MHKIVRLWSEEGGEYRLVVGETGKVQLRGREAVRLHIEDR